MTRRLIRTALTATVLLSGAGSLWAGWKRELVSFGDETSLAVDALGHPHMAIFDNKSGESVLRHAFIDEKGRRRIERVAKYEYAYLGGIAVGRQGDVHIALVHDDLTGDPMIKYLFSNGQGWNETTVDHGRGAALALEPDDTPHICYQADGEIRHARFGGSGWMVEKAADLSPVWISIAVDAGGHTHIAAGGLYSGADYLTDASGSWTLQAVDPNGYAPTLAVEGTGTPHIVYWEAGHLTYAVLDGSGWVGQVIPVDGYSGADLAVSEGGVPHVAFSHFSTSPHYDLGYATLQGGLWDVALFPARDADTGISTSIALDPLGLPHLSSIRDDGEFSVVQYVHLEEPDLVGTLLGVGVGNPATGPRLSGRLRAENRGTGAARRFTVTFHLSDDAQLDAGDAVLGAPRRLPAVAPGRTVSLPFGYRPSISPSGRYLIAMIQPEDASAEADTTNNTSVALIP